MRNAFIALALSILLTASASAQRRTERVILVTLDGARWQEIFGGIDLPLFEKIDKNAAKSEFVRRFNAPTAVARREKLMPYFWRTLMTNHGSVAGNRELGSEVKTTNNLLFSYPGYSEILTGQAHDDVITSNDRIQNRFPSVLQFLQTKLNLNRNQVASFASWEVMNEIAASTPNAFVINAGYEMYDTPDADGVRLSRTQFETPTPWRSVRHDFYTFRLAMSHLQMYRPTVLHIGLGETDDWAHDRNYEQMVEALHRTDRYLKELWEFIESDPGYRGKTSIMITVDHGRGSTEKDWHGHGREIPEARSIWMAFISPDSKRRGEWKQHEPLFQNQVAATLSRMLGLDYAEQNPNAGKPIAALF